MALPFNLHAFASPGEPSGGAPAVPGDNALKGAPRPSRAIHLSRGLIDQVRAHDVEALRELVQLTYTPLVRFARTIVGSQGSAEDVVQDVFTIVWDRGEQWNPTGDPAAYLFTSVRNHALNELRRRAREQRREQRAYDELAQQCDDPQQDHTPTTLDQVVAAETDAVRIQLVETVLSTLTERQRTAYDLRYRRGLTASAIAEVLGITVKSAEQLVSRVTHLVLARLRQEMSAVEVVKRS